MNNKNILGQKVRQIGGDVNYVEFGGLFVNDHTSDCMYFKGLDFYAYRDDNKGDDQPVYKFTIPDNVFEYYSWASVEDIAGFIGESIEKVFRDSVSEEITDRAILCMDIGNYYGYECFDETPNTYDSKYLELICEDGSWRKNK